MSCQEFRIARGGVNILCMGGYHPKRVRVEHENRGPNDDWTGSWRA